MIGVESFVPDNPKSFVDWAYGAQANMASLFEEGILDTPALRLGQLAALEVIRTICSPSKSDAIWWRMQQRHHKAYLGGHERVVAKLSDRLGCSERAINEYVSPEVMKARRILFGLPQTLRMQHTKGREWLEANEDSVAGTAGYKLYRGVLKELARP
jgi:hypothetical protein